MTSALGAPLGVPKFSTFSDFGSLISLIKANMARDTFILGCTKWGMKGREKQLL